MKIWRSMIYRSKDMPSDCAYFWNQACPTKCPDAIVRKPDAVGKNRPKIAYFWRFLEHLIHFLIQYWIYNLNEGREWKHTRYWRVWQNLNKPKSVNYMENGQKMSKNWEKWALIKINHREFQGRFFNSVSVFRKLIQFSLTYLTAFSLTLSVHL